MHDSHAPRLNLYAFIHKALRALLADTLVKVGRMDAHDPADRAGTLAQTRLLLRFCADHLDHENRFIHAAMEARRPGSSGATAEDHVHHEQHIDELEAAVQAVERLQGPARGLAAGRLYRQLGLFVAENLEHMEIEESENNAVLWDVYTDEELLGIHAALVATIPPEDMALTLHWMAPALTPQELALLFQDLRAKAPAPVFEALSAQIRPLLRPVDWDKLQQNLQSTVEAL